MDSSVPSLLPNRRNSGVLVVVLALVPALSAVLRLGRVHPDETYQYLEPAFSRVRGYGVLAWEWQVGLRNWAVPGLLSWFLRLSDRLGVESPRGYRAVMELPLVVLHAAALFAVLRYARRKVDSERLALLSLGLFGLYGPLLELSGRTLGETFSAGFLLLALEVLDREGRPVRTGLLSGAYLGLAVVARYGSGVFVLIALVWLAVRREWLKLALCGVAGAVVAGALGVLDKVTWGDWFHSLIFYLRFNVLTHDAADRFGVNPVYFFIPAFISLFPLWAWVGAWRAVRRQGNIPLGLLLALGYLVAVSATPHKEVRFLYPAMVLALMDAVPGFVTWLGSRPGVPRIQALRWGLTVLVGLVPGYFLLAERPEQFQAITAATRGSDTRGLLVVNEGLWGAGGYFYIGKRIPWTLTDHATDAVFQQAMRSPVINRVVTYDDTALPELEAAGFHVMQKMGHAKWLAR